MQSLRPEPLLRSMRAMRAMRTRPLLRAVRSLRTMSYAVLQASLPATVHALRAMPAVVRALLRPLRPVLQPVRPWPRESLRHVRPVQHGLRPARPLLTANYGVDRILCIRRNGCWKHHVLSAVLVLYCKNKKCILKNDLFYY